MAAILFAKYFKQESIMEVDEDGNATLYYIPSDQYIPAGKMQEVEDITNENSYTKVGDKFYVAK
jgi:hypothetical protein